MQKINVVGIGILALSIFMVSGCATSGKLEKTLSAWSWHDENELVEVWGPPEKTFPMQNGGQVFEYYFSNGMSGNATYSAYSSSFNVYENYCKVDFTLNQQNLVSSWRYYGNICRAKYPNSHLPRQTASVAKAGENSGNAVSKGDHEYNACTDRCHALFEGDSKNANSCYDRCLMSSKSN